MAKRADENQPDVVKDLRQMGYSVEPIHTLGKGRPDLLVGKYGFNFLFELKNPDQPPSKRKLTDNEEDWHENWQGHIGIAFTAEEIHKHIQGILEIVFLGHKDMSIGY